MGKKPAASEDVGAEGIVLEYLKKQNRPYNAVDVYNNMHGSVPKTGVEKFLTTLAEKGEIKMKVNGKQKIFVANQDHMESPPQAELDKMDDELNALKEQLTAIKEEIRSISGGLTKLQSSLTVEQMQTRLTTLEAENAKRAERLKVLRKGENNISPEDAKRINKAYEKNVKAWRQRRKMCKNILDMILENANMKAKDLMETIGIETDEDVGAVMPTDV